MTWRFLRFNTVGALGIGVQLFAVAGLAGGAGLAPELASALGVMLAVAHNFAWHRRWTWADRRHPTRPVAASFLLFAGTNGLISIAGSVLAALILTRLMGLSAMLSNAIAIVVTGLLNYWVADRAVFVGAGARGAAPPRSATGLSWAVARASSHVHGVIASRHPHGEPGDARLRGATRIPGEPDLHGVCGRR